ncbi:MAG: GNAT family N-acetyltransferase [Deltaproteobacteria bacterium]|nr:GNAT family N-acetyltransferase [Deltaproteobacteria bacterium]
MPARILSSQATSRDELLKLHSLIASVYAASPYMSQPAEEKYPNVEALARELERSLVVVAEDGGRLQGYLTVARHDTAKLRHTAELNMGVAPAAQGRGVGRLLLETAFAALPERGIEIVYLHVRADNAPGVRLYESFGFERLCVLDRDTKIDGRYFDAVLMRKRVG